MINEAHSRRADRLISGKATRTPFLHSKRSNSQKKENHRTNKFVSHSMRGEKTLTIAVFGEGNGDEGKSGEEAKLVHLKSDNKMIGILNG